MNEIELVVPIEALPKARCTRCNAVLRSDNTGTKCSPCVRVLGDAVTKQMGETVACRTPGCTNRVHGTRKSKQYCSTLCQMDNQRKLQNERRRAAKVSQ